MPSTQNRQTPKSSVLGRMSFRVLLRLLVTMPVLSQAWFMWPSWAAEAPEVQQRSGPAPIATLNITPTQAEWQILLSEEYASVQLTIKRPDRVVIRRYFNPGEPIVFSAESAASFHAEQLNDGRSAEAKRGRPQPRPDHFFDGQYNSQLLLIPASPPQTYPAPPPGTYSAGFTIVDGQFLMMPQQSDSPQGTQPQALNP